MHDHRDVRVILGRATNHGRTTYVDEFDRWLGGERIEVHDHERNRLDTEAREIGAMRRIVEVGQDPAMDGRMKCDDTMAENRLEPRDGCDVGDVDPSIGERTGRAAARKNRPPCSTERTCELDDSGLVVHTDERGRHSVNANHRAPPPHEGY